MAEQWATKDALFKETVPRERHTIPGIGDVWIHGLTCGEKDDYENKAVTVLAGSREIRMANARALLILWTVHNQHRARLFADKDLGKVCRIPAVVAEPMYDKARRLSRFSAADIEELAKNSETIQDGGTDTE